MYNIQRKNVAIQNCQKSLPEILEILELVELLLMYSGHAILNSLMKDT